MEPNLTPQDMLLVRRALEAYHVHLMAFNPNYENSPYAKEVKRVEDIFVKIGEVKV